MNYDDICREATKVSLSRRRYQELLEIERLYDELAAELTNLVKGWYRADRP